MSAECGAMPGHARAAMTGRECSTPGQAQAANSGGKPPHSKAGFCGVGNWNESD